MTIRLAVDTLRVKKAICAWLEDEFGGDVAVRIGDQNYPSGPYPLVTAKLTLPPAPTHLDGEVTRLLPTSVQVDFANPTAGKEYRLLVNRWPVDHTAAGTDPNTVRDAVVAAINAATFPEPVTATALGGAGSMQIDQVLLGDLREVRGVPRADVTIATLATAMASEVVGARTALLTLEIFARSPARSNSADAIAATILAGLKEESTIMRLRQSGIGYEGAPSAPRDLSALSGTEIEQRVQIDVRLFFRSRLTKPMTPIENVEIEQQTPYAQTFTVSAP